jgi:flagellar motor switch protein FliN/FliY
MPLTLTNDALCRALAREIADACAAALGGPASLESATAGPGAGWMASIPFSGAASGRMTLWLDEASASAYVGRVLADTTEPSDEAIAQSVKSLVGRAVSAVEASPEGAGIIGAEADVQRAPAPDGADAYVVVLADDLRLGFRVQVSLEVSAQPDVPKHGLADSRLEAVLEVDLPLIVRFGRAIMPLRNVADLSPGAVVDMGRTPDEPVELLVGERLVARGEVVIVGGNYGVRITELTSGRRSTDMEARG